jgi:hypothetical protein
MATTTESFHLLKSNFNTKPEEEEFEDGEPKLLPPRLRRPVFDKGHTKYHIPRQSNSVSRENHDANPQKCIEADGSAPLVFGELMGV